MMPIAPAIAPAAGQLMILVMLLGGLRVPLAIPPGPGDPWLARIAPEECLYYSNWAGVVAPDPNSRNSTEQLLGEPEVQRFLSQPFFVAEVFTGSPGKYVTLKETIADFKAILAGEYDHLPEQAFLNVGGAEDVMRKAAELEKEA